MNKLFVDMDDCLTQSSKAYCQCYNDLFQNNPNFIPADYTKNNDWNFSEVAPLMKDNTELIFSHPLFFDNLEFFPNALEVLQELQKKYEIYIVTIGTLKNLELKAKFIHKKLPFIKNVILLSNEGCQMNKSIVDMSNHDNDEFNIFLDDNEGNLYSQQNTSNLVRYAYGIKKPWNSQWINQGGRHLKDWNEVRNALL